ncbi:cytochrome P450 98A2 [Lactuca sativa]|uniref:cytochrome P450 98A2 n=1 Tax=Lactuca sativa TaxID=4236 RepID=UPI001C68B433|nr:cytochrome P450 98A2 [Lactuca sativa]
MSLKEHDIIVAPLFTNKSKLMTLFPTLGFLTSSSMVIEVLSLSITLIIIIIFTLHRRLGQNLPPGPCPWPIVGNMYQIRPNDFRLLTKWCHVYGPIISFQIGSSICISVSNPHLAKEVLKNHDNQLANRHRTIGIARFSRNGDDLTWADYGPRFVKLKKLCVVELFSLKNLEAHRSTRENDVSIMIDSINKDYCGKVLVVKNCLKKTMFNIIARMLFGNSLVSYNGELNAILEAQFRAKVSLGVVEEVSWLRCLSWLKDNENKWIGSRNHRFFQAIIIQKKENQNTSTHQNNLSFLDALLSRREEYNLSDNTISGLLWDMVTAGIDTIVAALEWAMTELLINPAVKRKAQEELDRVIGFGEVMTDSDIPNLPYLTCVVKETLRLHPPTPLMLPHQATTNLKIGSFGVPKGSRVYVNVWAIGRDPHAWKQPLVFQPERFLEEDVDIKGHDFRLLAFGSGRRMCPGAQLGMNMVTLMLGSLLHRFEWSLPEGFKAEEVDMVEMLGIVAYKKIPLEVVPTPRLPKHASSKDE